MLFIFPEPILIFSVDFTHGSLLVDVRHKRERENKTWKKESKKRLLQPTIDPERLVGGGKSFPYHLTKSSSQSRQKPLQSGVMLHTKVLSKTFYNPSKSNLFRFVLTCNDIFKNNNHKKYKSLTDMQKGLVNHLNHKMSIEKMNTQHTPVSHDPAIL